MRTRNAFLGTIVLTGAALLASPANAGILTVELLANGSSIWSDSLGTASDGPQSDTFSNVGHGSQFMASVSGSNLWDSDPMMSYDFQITNNTATPMQFTMVFTTNINPALTNPFGLEMNGSVSGGGLDHGTNDAFTAAQAVPVGGVAGNANNWAHAWIPSNSSHYRAYIDSNLVRTLFDDPQADGQNHLLWWGGQFSTPSYGPASFGQPVPELTPGPALVDMKLEIDFVLSENDSFTSNGFFEVVPAPGAFALLGVAGLTLRRRRRA